MRRKSFFISWSPVWGRIGDSAGFALPLRRWPRALPRGYHPAEATKMASLEFRSNRYRLGFRFGGKKYQHPLKTSNQREAEGCLGRLEENLRLLERGRLELPPDADLADFLLSDGKVN